MRNFISQHFTYFVKPVLRTVFIRKYVRFLFGFLTLHLYGSDTTPVGQIVSRGSHLCKIVFGFWLKKNLYIILQIQSMYFLQHFGKKKYVIICFCVAIRLAPERKIDAPPLETTKKNYVIISKNLFGLPLLFAKLDKSMLI